MKTNGVLKIRLTEAKLACTPHPKKSCGALELTLHWEPGVLFKDLPCHALVW